DKGQAMWAAAYLRPVRDVPLPKEVADRFLPAADYARAKPVDYGKMETVQKGFSDKYLAEVK
ncbi:MAG: ABC transporter substrate-binding protein, partial [Azorhizobium sp. 35-67-15]